MSTPPQLDPLHIPKRRALGHPIRLEKLIQHLTIACRSFASA